MNGLKENVMNLEPPTDWGSDPIAEFMDLLRSNTFATFENCRQHYDRLVAINGVYTRLIDHLDDANAWFKSLFLLNAHACYLGAIQLSCGGQLPQSHMVLRGCIENSLYGFFFHIHPEKEKIWESRQDTPENARMVRAEFKIGAIMKQFGKTDESIGPVVTELYNMTIDLGAHPNVWGLYPHLDLPDDDPSWLGLRYVTDEVSDIVIGLQNCARAGICSLSIFGHVFEQKSSDLGLSSKIEKLKSGL